MGLVTGIIRLQFLRQRELDLEFKIQTLTETKMHLAEQSFELVSIGTDLDPDSPEAKHLETRRKKLQIMEKKIDAEILKCQNMLKMISTESQSAQNIIDRSIQRNFSYGVSQ